MDDLHFPPGVDVLNGMGGALPSAPKDLFQHTRRSGGAKARHPDAEDTGKQADKDKDEWEKSQVGDEASENRSPDESTVTLRNLTWSLEQGVFNRTILARADAELPPEKENLTKLSFTLFALTPDGKRERIDSKEAHIKEGFAEQEFTLYYPQYREDGELVSKCEFIFLAKHRLSEVSESPKLGVVQKEFCLMDIKEALESLEKEEGADVAQMFVGKLRYQAVCELATKGGTENDPSMMPSRFFLLPGAGDESLKAIDPHPDDGSHKISVGNLRRAMALIGYEVSLDGPFDEVLKSEFGKFLESRPQAMDAKPVFHKVVEGDTLGGISKKYGIPSWKLLYAENKDIIGKNPDRISIGSSLKLPDEDMSKGGPLLRQRGCNLNDFIGQPGYSYPWVSFSFTLSEDGETTMKLNGQKACSLTIPESKRVLFSGPLSGLGPFTFLVPDAEGALLEIDSLQLGDTDA